MKTKKAMTLALATALSLGGVAYAGGPKAGAMGGAGGGGSAVLMPGSPEHAKEQTQIRTRSHQRVQQHSGEADGAFQAQLARERLQIQNRLNKPMPSVASPVAAE